MSSYKDEFNLDDYTAETETNDALDKEVKGNESYGFKSKSGYFQIENDAVKVTYPIKVKGETKTFEHTFKVYSGIYIVDACLTKDGELVTACGGQNYVYLLTCVPEKIFRKDWGIKRHIFVTYLMQLEKAIEEKQAMVKTVFGLKALEYKSKDGQEAVDVDDIDFA